MTDAIDPYSEYSLHDIVAGDLPRGESTEYMGFHLVGQGDGRVHAQLDGHAGSVETFDAADYDDVLELVNDLNGLVIRREEHEAAGFTALCAWAGPIVTADPEQATDDNYLYVPHDPTDD